MTNIEINEGNKLIAEFMGAKVTQEYPANKDYEQDGLLFYYPEKTSPSIYRNLSSTSVKYYSSWDWLMDVVEKIEDLGHIVFIVKKDIYIKSNSTLSSPTIAKSEDQSSKIEAVYFAIVEFIQWYNSEEMHKPS